MIQIYSNNYDVILLSIDNQSSYYKNPTDLSCIDLFFTNSRSSFQKSTGVEIGLSEFHKPIVTVMKSDLPKQTPNIVTYKNTPILTKTNVLIKFMFLKVFKR